MNLEQVLGAALLVCGVYLLVSVVLNFATLASEAILSAANPFLVEVSLGIFLVIFGLYMMKIILRKK